MKTRILFLITLLCAAFQDMLSQNSNNLWKWIAPKIHRMAVLPAVVAFTLLFHAAPAQATSIYVTASGDTSVFGTLDLATGQFSQIATTNQGFSGLTTGSGGTIYGTDVVSGHLYTISPAGVTTQFGSSTQPPAPYGFDGLAYSSSTGSFFAVYADKVNGVFLYSIAGDGNSNSTVGQMGGPFYIASGNLAFGPSGNLYFDYSTDNVNGTNPSLYTVNTSTGALTAVGSGLGSPFLTLFSVGSTLYGIDTIATSNIGIYTINTTTGIATPTGVIVIGLPSGYTLDTATSISPCPQPQGYWKNNPDAWPVSALPMTLGSQTYTQAELLTILRTPTGKGTKADASLILADQLIAAKLNIANGADGTPVTSTIADADAVLSLYTGKLPYRVRTNTTNGRRMVNDAATLESYNNGLLTPGCGG